MYAALVDRHQTLRDSEPLGFGGNAQYGEPFGIPAIRETQPLTVNKLHSALGCTVRFD